MSEGIDPALQTAALAALEQALNRALNLAPAARAELEKLDDCVFALQCTSPEIDVYLQTQEQGIRLMGYCDMPVTTSVRGAVSDFTELATATDPTATLINGNLELEGDSGPLIELQKILANLDIDWEAPLVERLGDVAGHQLAQALRSMFGWGQATAKSLARQLGEFIHEEARLTPPKLELEDFYHDVHELGQRVERLAARATRLRKQLDKVKP